MLGKIGWFSVLGSENGSRLFTNGGLPFVFCRAHPDPELYFACRRIDAVQEKKFWVLCVRVVSHGPHKLDFFVPTVCTV